MNNMSKKSKSKRFTSSKKSVQSNGISWSIPPADVSCRMRNQIARYECNANLSSSAISAQKLIATLCTLADSTTTAWSLLYAIRIRKIILYSPALLSSTVNTITFEWGTPSGADFGTAPKSVTSGSLGTSAGSKQVMKPPASSPWSKWITLTSPGAVSVWVASFPVGTTVELHYDAYVENRDSSLQLTGASSLSVGANYRWGIDGLPLASTNYIPLGFRGA